MNTSIQHTTQTYIGFPKGFKQPVSKLPSVGTTIFTVMSALANEYHAVNLGQGFPDFECDSVLIECVNTAMKSGLNQYPPMVGLPVLREAIAQKISRLYRCSYDPTAEITITAGATQAIFTAIQCCVCSGDEVIVIEPAYDSYVPAIELAGGTPVFVHMELREQGFVIPWQQVAEAVTRKTRLIIINSPHNPTGAVLRKADLQALSDIIRGTDILLLSDEVYEHMVYDGAIHSSDSPIKPS